MESIIANDFETHEERSLLIEKPRLVVLGVGFAAFRLIKDIDFDRFDVTLVSPRNHFLFTPLLTSTTVGTIEFRSIIEPVRAVEKKLSYYQAASRSIDLEKQVVVCESVSDGSQFDVPFDYLAIAVGCVSNSFNIPGVTDHCFYLKELPDARRVRQRIIECFEEASLPGRTFDERSRLLNFVIVGGGPTGIELAAELHDFLVGDVRRWYPSLAAEMNITVLEASTRILNSFDARLRNYTLKAFRKRRIVVRTGSLVEAVEKDHVLLSDGSTVPFGLCVWSAGLAPTSFVAGLPFEKTRSGRLVVDHFLRVKGYPRIFALGDCSAIEDEEVPQTAQVAQQEGKYLARELNAVAAREEPKPFTHRKLGMLAYIGGRRALADLPGVKGHGFVAWLFWRSVYLTKLVSVKNKLLVLFDWIKTSLFGRDISRF